MSFMTKVFTLLAVFAASSALFAADSPVQGITKVFEGQLKMIESEVVPLAEAMPADKYDFAPTTGEFKGVRTFSQEFTHIATVIYELSAASLGEKTPVATGKNENGAPSIHGKDAVVKYLKDSLVYAHKAVAALTAANIMEPMQSPFGSQKSSRLDLLSEIAWHTYDHYGQCVEYARLNSIVPPASR
jgi:DinB superfamily